MRSGQRSRVLVRVKLKVGDGGFSNHFSRLGSGWRVEIYTVVFVLGRASSRIILHLLVGNTVLGADIVALFSTAASWQFKRILV